METTLLWSCLSLPKIALVPSMHATLHVPSQLLESLFDLAGSPLTGWIWLKANLPSSRGGLNIRRAFKHASAASVAQSRSLVELVLRYDALPMIDLSSQSLYLQIGPR